MQTSRGVDVVLLQGLVDAHGQVGQYILDVVAAAERRRADAGRQLHNERNDDDGRDGDDHGDDDVARVEAQQTGRGGAVGRRRAVGAAILGRPREWDVEEWHDERQTQLHGNRKSQRSERRF